MISIVYCTKESKPTHTKHISDTIGIKNCEIFEVINNGDGLTKPYNSYLAKAKFDIVVFVHDDVTFETKNWGKKLLKHFETNQDFGILGVAGTTDLPSSGMWWEDRAKMVGIVNHKKDNKKWESKYSKAWDNILNEVVIIDGLFFAVHKKRIKNRFDEDVSGYHFYDVDFSFRNHLDGVKIGVMTNIRVTHSSIGLTNDEWENNRIKFTQKFSEKLPYKLVPDFFLQEMKLKESKCKIKIIVQVTKDSDDFIRWYIRNIEKYLTANISVIIISSENNYNELKKVDIDNVELFEGFYDSLSKNLSILKFEENFITNDDELLFFMTDKNVILNNIFSSISQIYTNNRYSFGCAFPLTFNQDKTIFSSKLEILVDGQNKVGIKMKDNGSYYNVFSGVIENPIGNLSDCFVTSVANFKNLDGFKLSYETPLYFNEFALRLYLNKKINYCDTNSLVIQDSFVGDTPIQKEFQELINYIGGNEKLRNILKKI